MRIARIQGWPAASFFPSWVYVKIKKSDQIVPLSFSSIVPKWLKHSIRYLRFAKEFETFRAMTERLGSRFSLSWNDRYPCLLDKTANTDFDAHYIYHPAWAARVLARTRPERHIDISSTLHFCSLVSAFIPVEFYDFRPADLALSGLSSQAANLSALPFDDSSVSSLSCMHVVEHVGLGRYGDQLDPDGDLKAISELKRVIAYGGNLLFVVPIGSPKIIFNAHRVYSYEQIVEYFREFKLVDFSLIPDHGSIITGASKELADSQVYGCGCFHFSKEGI